VLIAGSASATGASRLLLKAAELGLVEGVTSQQAATEAARNLSEKLPSVVPAFQELLASCVTVLPDPSAEQENALRGQAHPEDLPLLAAAVQSRSHFLVTFNVRHYFPTGGSLRVLRPGALMTIIRQQLIEMTQGGC